MGESVNARVRGSQSRAAKSEEERKKCRKRGERGGAADSGRMTGRGGAGAALGWCRGRRSAAECGVSVARPGGGFWVCEAGLSLGCGRSAIARLQKVGAVGQGRFGVARDRKAGLV